ncbi:MAG: hypothetical protein ACK5L3_08675 [Oscillospiraceae bacterium]
MKIKAIAKLCAKNEVIRIYNRRPVGGGAIEQWVSNGGACFPLASLPYMEEDVLFQIFDVPEKNQKKYFCETKDAEELGIDFADVVQNEKQVEEFKTRLIFGGRELILLQTDKEIVFIDAANLAPVADEIDGLEYFVRETMNGSAYIVLKAGFMLRAVIMPVVPFTNDFVEELLSMARQAHEANLRKKNSPQ